MGTNLCPILLFLAFYSCALFLSEFWYVMDMHSVMEQKQERLLKENGFNVFPDNEICKNCHLGIVGCCFHSIEMTPNEFTIDFTSYEDVVKLISTGLFWLDVKDSNDYVMIFLRVYQVIKKYISENNYGQACILWTKKGCRLSSGTRPFTCRYHHCKPGSYEKYRDGDYRGVFSEEESRILMKVANEYKITRLLTHEEYLEIDWDKLKNILQLNEE